MAIFRSFKMAAAAVLDFRNFKYLAVGTVKTVELRHHAKIRRNSSNRGWYYGDYSIFQAGGRPPSGICDACVGTAHEVHLLVFINLQNFVGIDAVVLTICTFFHFASLAWKRLFTPQNFFCFLPPKWGAMWTNTQKAHPCARTRRLSHHA